MTTIPDEAFAAALAGLQHLTPLRLRALLARLDPATAWQRILAGTAFPDGLPSYAKAQDPAAVLREQARVVDPASVWAQCQAGKIGVAVLGDDRYPAALADDPFAPAVLFWRGRLDALDRRRVAIVGTRRATAVGRELATELGRDLAQHDVGVVSGLAAGIDGAAHRGVLRAAGGAPPIGVVGSGLDVPYPTGHRELWELVATHGLLLAEVPPGSLPMAHRFPQRNRVIAALGEITVVVESRERGGSLLTADEANARGRPVMAVPGSPRNEAAVGTNGLLRDGCAPVHGVADVLMELGLGQLLFASRTDHRRVPTPADNDVLELMADRPLTLNDLVAATGRDLPQVALSLARLEVAGWVVETGGNYERIHTPSR
jgi:DNA processing protein